MEAHTLPATPPRRQHAATASALSSPWSSPSAFRFSPRQRFGGRAALMEAQDTSKDTSTRVRYTTKREGARRAFRPPSRSFAVKLAALVVVGGLLAWRTFFRTYAEPLRIPKREWPLQPYQHLDFSTPLDLPPSTHVLHVAKEFGPATMGGLGVMLTALSIAQAESPQHRISVILPHYSFLRTSPHADHVKPLTRLQIPITSSRGQVKLVGCQISVLKWEYSSMIDFLNPTLEVDDERDQRFIDIYLVGPGDESPFHVAFRAKDAGDVYSAYKPLKQEWKDLWFAKAAAELVLQLKASESTSVDAVHLHGATNAMVAYFLRQAAAASPLVDIPAIVYTLHDSLDEVEYSNLVSNAAVFLPPSPSPLANLSSYIHGVQIFTSATGIDLADMVTFVSRSIAADIVEGRFTFALQDLVMPSIAAKASEGAFIGVTNGLDFTEQAKNPFVSTLLVREELAFPRVDAELLDPGTFWEEERDDEEGVPISFTHTKERAKERLLELLPSLFSPVDLHRPLLLFIGRFQYNKGCEFFEPILESLASSTDPSLTARLVVLGARNNYPIKALRALQQRYPAHFTLIDDTTTLQEEYGPLIRMAADFTLVPSFSEAFGLVAAEGLLFGQEVISTGVGGLVEFLRPQVVVREDGVEGEESDQRQGNAHLFQLFDGVDVGEGSGTAGGDLSLRADQARPGKEALEPAVRRCVKVVGEAIRAWRARKGRRWIERERFLRRLVQDALDLKWDREHGPIDEMARVYAMAIRNARTRHRRSSPSSPIADDRRRDENAEAPKKRGGATLPIYKVWRDVIKKEAVLRKITTSKKSGGSRKKAPKKGQRQGKSGKA